MTEEGYAVELAGNAAASAAALCPSTAAAIAGLSWRDVVGVSVLMGAAA